MEAMSAPHETVRRPEGVSPKKKAKREGNAGYTPKKGVRRSVAQIYGCGSKATIDFTRGCVLKMYEVKQVAKGRQVVTCDR